MNEMDDRTEQVNWLRELGSNIANWHRGSGSSAAEAVEYALSADGTENMAIDWPEWFDDHDKALLVEWTAKSM